MIISNITPPQVWSASARSLTNFGSGALAPVQSVVTSIAGAATVDFRPSAGILASQTIGVVTGAAATGAIQILSFDGTSNISLAITAASPNAPAGFSAFATNTVWQRANNSDATHAGFYSQSGFLFTI